MNRDKVEPDVTSFPGKNAKKWVNYHKENAAPSTYVYEFVWNAMDEAIGPFCKDVDGNILLDMTAHVGANTLGYNNPKLEEKIDDLFNTFDPTKIAGQDFYVGTSDTPSNSDIPNPSELMDRLTDISSQYNMDTVFLSNTGAEAVENAIKICYHHTSGKYGITFDGAFHGRTLGTLSLNRSKGKYRENFPEISSIESVPYCRDYNCSKDTCSCGFFTRDHESLLDRLVGVNNGQMNPNEISYIILEPIQGEGGYYVPSDSFMDEVSRISEKYNIPVISDEVQAGIGRTGEWWGIDNYSIEPDVISAAKPVRVGATIGKSDVFPDKSGRLSSTWGAGDLIATAQGVATIDVIEENNLMENAVSMGNLFTDLLDKSNFDTISDIRQKGLMIGVEFTSEEERSKVVSKSLEEGLLLLACGNKTIRILPPLDVTEREIRMVTSMMSDIVE